MPLGPYKDFAACVAANQDKDDPEAYCGALEADAGSSAKKADVVKWTERASGGRSVEQQMKVVTKSEPERYTLGVVYEPDVKDAHGDHMTAEDIRRSAHDYLRRLQGVDDTTQIARSVLAAVLKASDGDTVRLDLTEVADRIEKGAGLNEMHEPGEEDGSLGDVVESYIAPADMEVDGDTVRKGTWMMGVVWSEQAFAKIQAGERTGYSLEGLGSIADGGA